jgi:hypothetical protein
MSRREKILVLSMPVLALLAAFWFLLLAPKRHEASKLSDQASKLHKSVDELQQQVAEATQAKTGYQDYYASLIGLGKAVPKDADTPALYVQLSHLARKAHVKFDNIDLKDTGTGTTSAGASNNDLSTKDNAKGKGSTAPAGNTASTPAAATESSAAGLPLGASIGTAGFPVMPYDLTFRGSFFRIADFIHGLDRLVSTRGGDLAVRGRLLTIDGFSLSTLDQTHFPDLTASFNVTAYVTPEDQGITAGGTSTGPASASSTQPVSTAGGTP